MEEAPTSTYIDPVTYRLGIAMKKAPEAGDHVIIVSFPQSVSNATVTSIAHTGSICVEHEHRDKTFATVYTAQGTSPSTAIFTPEEAELFTSKRMALEVLESRGLTILGEQAEERGERLAEMDLAMLKSMAEIAKNYSEEERP